MSLTGEQKRERPGTQRPGGRTERTRRAVAQAVLDLFADGESGLNMSEIAARAGVHRSTLHRRWPTRAALIEEALTLHTSRIEIPDTGSFADDIVALARSLAGFFSDPVEVALNAALAIHADRQVDAAQIAYWISLLPDVARPIQQAIERGELQADMDPLVLLNLLIGPLLMYTALVHTTPEPWLVDQFALAVGRAGKATRQVEERVLELIGQRPERGDPAFDPIH
jgi:AcrR family transcriptional regulator